MAVAALGMNSRSSRGKHTSSKQLKEQARYRRLRELEQLQGKQTLLGNTTSTGPHQQLSESLEKELQGLRAKGDPYDAGVFSDEHTAFKEGHNEAFSRLALGHHRGKPREVSRPVFYLDGPDGGTTRCLTRAGLDPATELFVANEWSDTVAALRAPPLRHPNVHFGSATESLTTTFHHTKFCAAYLDGCGGCPNQVIAMIEALLSVPRDPCALVIGFTLTAAEPSGRELIDRIQDVTRATLRLATKSPHKTSSTGVPRQSQYRYMRHIMDDPDHYGIEPTLSRKHQGTTTCWLELTP